MRISRRLVVLPAFLSLLAILAGGDPGAAMAQPARPGAPAAAPAAPTITSTGKNVYVSGSATNYVGTPGQFTLSDPGSTVTGYNYTFGAAGIGTFVPAGADGTATLAITPYSETVLVLYVNAVDGTAFSQPSSFTIETLTKGNSNIATLAWWKLNAGHGATAADSTGDLHVATLQKDASFSCAGVAAPDGYRCSMQAGGKGGQARTAPAILPVVGNSFGFSVSEWVSLSACASSCVALSADATQTNEFALSYSRSCTAAGKTGACWQFSMPVGDSASAKVMTAASPPGSAKLAKWTQLTGVFESAHGTLTLYVNGHQAGQVTGLSRWPAPANGRVRIGNLLPGGSTRDWHGRLSNACVFFGSLVASDVTTLYTGDTAHPHNGCAALDALYP